MDVGVCVITCWQVLPGYELRVFIVTILAFYNLT